MSKVRDTTEHPAGTELAPLDARSLALSVLLGTHPPVLPARALVALAGLFGIAGGTMRTALSRMVAAGELELDDGRYRLAGRMLDRQRSQDLGRRQPDGAWDGTWHTVIAAADQRLLADRRRFRATMGNHRFGELRPDIWMRPTNLDPPPPAADVMRVSGPLAGVDVDSLCRRLWDLDLLRRRGDAQRRRLSGLAAATDWSDPASIVPVFVASAAVVRYLRDDPLLPATLTPSNWPTALLRTEYDDVERDLQRLLRQFLTAAA